MGDSGPLWGVGVGVAADVVVTPLPTDRVRLSADVDAVPVVLPGLCEAGLVSLPPPPFNTIFPLPIVDNS